uniref:Uncharacterized protein n=1 Tax=Rhizophora mucronata TaxID=61149 RepID=A0A2P2R4E9_RHIMU
MVFIPKMQSLRSQIINILLALAFQMLGFWLGAITY